MIVTVDHGKCQGYANCVLAAAELFDLDGDGKVVLLVDGEVPSELADSARAAAMDCPVRAVLIEE